MLAIYLSSRAESAGIFRTHSGIEVRKVCLMLGSSVHTCREVFMLVMPRGFYDGDILSFNVSSSLAMIHSLCDLRYFRLLYCYIRLIVTSYKYV